MRARIERQRGRCGVACVRTTADQSGPYPAVYDGRTPLPTLSASSALDPASSTLRPLSCGGFWGRGVYGEQAAWQVGGWRGAGRVSTRLQEEIPELDAVVLLELPADLLPGLPGRKRTPDRNIQYHILPRDASGRSKLHPTTTSSGREQRKKEIRDARGIMGGGSRVRMFPLRPCESESPSARLSGKVFRVDPLPKQRQLRLGELQRRTVRGQPHRARVSGGSRCSGRPRGGGGDCGGGGGQSVQRGEDVRGLVFPAAGLQLGQGGHFDVLRQVRLEWALAVKPGSQRHLTHRNQKIYIERADRNNINITKISISI